MMFLWAIKYNAKNGLSFIDKGSVRRTRSAAIQHYKSGFKNSHVCPDKRWRNQTRKGEVRAVQVFVTEIPNEEKLIVGKIED